MKKEKVKEEVVSETTEEVKVEKTGKGKNTIIIILIIAVVLLLAVVWFLLFGRNNKPTNNHEPGPVEPSPNKPIDNPAIKPLDEAYKKENTTAYNYDLVVYYDTDEEYFCYMNTPEDCGKNKINIKTETFDASKLDEYEDKYVFYKDNGKIKYYDATKKESYVINLPSSYFSYIFSIDDVTDEIIGVIVQEDVDGNSGFFSFELNKVLYDKEYKELYFLNKDYLNASQSDCKTDSDGYEICDQTDIYLLSTKEEKVLLSDAPVKDSEGYYEDVTYGLLYNDKGLYIFEGSFIDSYAYYKVYNSDFKIIAKNTDEYEADIGKDGNLYVAKNGVVSIYNRDGKVLKSSKKYNVQMLVGEYIVAIKDNNLIIATVDGKEVKLASWNKNKNFLHVGLSGWYTEDKKPGIYLVVEDNSVSKDAVWESCKKYGCDVESKSELDSIDKGYEYYYIPETGETGKIPTTIGGYAKPVLYLYPETETKVTVTFDKPGNLTTTYPKYIKSWEVLASPNGDLHDKDNKYYYGLYWEEKKNHEVDFSEGFYVDGKSAIEFLESKLSYLGLNDRERNEFIMYWLPILEKNGHSLVYFEQTKERDQYSKINITPAPDSMLRISMHVKKVNGKVNIKEQKLETFNRVGFSAVEWGGVIH